MKRVKENNKIVVETNSGNEIVFSCSYPNENPENAIEDITSTLSYIGILDNLK